MTALAHAHHDHPTAASQHRGHRGAESRALACRQAEQRTGLDLEGLGGKFKGSLDALLGSQGRGEGQEGVSQPAPSAGKG